MKVTISGKVPEIKNSGKLELKSRSILNFSVEDGSSGTGGGINQNELGAVTTLQSASTVYFDKESAMLIQKGKLELAESTNATSSIAISGKTAAYALTIGEGASIRRAANPTIPVKLEVDGAILVSKIATIEMYAKRDENKNDEITATGIIKLKWNAEVNLKWFDDSATLRAVNQAWTLISSTWVTTPGNGTAITSQAFLAHTETDPVVLEMPSGSFSTPLKVTRTA